ncbi:hypothetical protein AVMA1855_15380 [Acidovorax sp. SUPP1855]|nr:hypothetical protein [Acidovorax sp. SUPP1855]GKS85550.1 hypothetical protein AVMA1855_15380 [Acidovorax sp. SUPP1855]
MAFLLLAVGCVLAMAAKDGVFLETVLVLSLIAAVVSCAKEHAA